jgi:hypothetical protein
MKEPFQESLETTLSLYRMSLAAGEVLSSASASAMHFPLLFFAAGLPLNGLDEPKLILFQEKSRQLHRPEYEAMKLFSKVGGNSFGISKERHLLRLTAGTNKSVQHN